MAYVMIYLGAEKSLLSLAAFLTISLLSRIAIRIKTGMPFCCVLARIIHENALASALPVACCGVSERTTINME
jgi:hypothetical protein